MILKVFDDLIIVLFHTNRVQTSSMFLCEHYFFLKNYFSLLTPLKNVVFLVNQGIQICWNLHVCYAYGLLRVEVHICILGWFLPVT